MYKRAVSACPRIHNSGRRPDRSCAESIVISTCTERGKRSKEESLTIEQKMTMLIRAVQDPSNLLYRGSITQAKVRRGLKEGREVGGGGSGPSAALTGCNDRKVGQALSSCRYT
jgi:hypothetical protein